MAVRYRRTQLGMLWLILAFALFVIIMGVKFAFLMGRDVHQFLPYLGAGYMTWRFLVTVVNDAVGTLSTHRAYIMDGRVRFTDYVLRSMVKSSVHFMFAAIVMVGVLAWSKEYSPLGLVTLFATFPLLAINVMWMALCLSFIGARFPDTQEVIGTVLMAGFLLTPIIWDISLFPVGTTRGDLTRLNPAFHLVELIRAPILGQMPELGTLFYIAGMAMIGWAMTAMIYRRYARFVPLWL